MHFLKALHVLSHFILKVPPWGRYCCQRHLKDEEMEVREVELSAQDHRAYKGQSQGCNPGSRCHSLGPKKNKATRCSCSRKAMNCAKVRGIEERGCQRAAASSVKWRWARANSWRTEIKPNYLRAKVKPEQIKLRFPNLGSKREGVEELVRKNQSLGIVSLYTCKLSQSKLGLVGRKVA